jgi:hypothetical protein
MTTTSSRSERIVSGLAVVVLVAGFASGVFAKPAQTTSHRPWLSAHLVNVQVQARD